jgi:ParB-like chromosome segregation protein Spo0J
VVSIKADPQIERRPIGALRPYERKARKHPPEQIAQIAASIREWGWTMPVLTEEQDLIIAGHGRVEAAKLIGIDTVPVIVARGSTEAQRRA